MVVKTIISTVYMEKTYIILTIIFVGAVIAEYLLVIIYYILNMVNIWDKHMVSDKPYY
mgnify:CR=1 FL=1